MVVLHRKIASSVRKKRKEVEGLERALADAERATAELRAALQHARPGLVEMEELLALAKGERGDQTAARGLRAGSKVAKAREQILLKRGPMHVAELLRAMGEEDTRSNRTSLGGSLGGYARRGEVFRKVGPNKFTLIELDGPEESDDQEGAEDDVRERLGEELRRRLANSTH